MPDYDYDDYEDELERDANSIISQIKNQSVSINQVKKEHPELKREELEEFVIKKTSTLIHDVADMVQALKIDVETGGDAKMVESAATLVNAFVNAVNTLSKIQLADNSNKNKKEIEQMRIDAKTSEQKNSSMQSGLYISREDLLKELLNRPVIKEPVKEETEEESVIDV